jgi:hypothetical protein
MNSTRQIQRTATVALIATLLSISTLAKEKNDKRVWQIGKLVNVEEAASQKDGYVIGNQGSILGGYSECRNWAYTVETESVTYVFLAHTGAWCADHPRPLTVGKQVKFSLAAKSKVLLIDEDGKEFTGTLVKKVMANHTR